MTAEQPEATSAPAALSPSDGEAQPMDVEASNGDAAPAPKSVAPTELPALKVTFYQLLLRQLQDDGFVSEAASLSQHLGLQPDPNVPRDALYESYGKSLKYAFEKEPVGSWTAVDCTAVPPIAHDEKALDFETDLLTAAPDGTTPSKQPPEVRLLYAAPHKQPCRAVTFSGDGRMCATGCPDGSIRIFDSARMRACAASTEGPLGRLNRTEDELNKPIVRTLQDHLMGVTCMAFHPANPTLFSGSLDKTVKIFDLTKPPGHKKAFHTFQDVHPVRSLCVHPCGDFVYVGTAHQAVRLYDLQTFSCFTGFLQDEHHSAGINDLRTTSDGRMLASASSDGAVKLWDATSMRVVNQLPRAHSGAPVTSLRFSRNLRYLLTSGLDGRHRIWDLRKGSEVFTLGFGPRSCEHSTAVFAAGEKYVVAVNSNWQLADTTVFESATGSPVQMKLGLHSSVVHALDASPVDKTVMTGCDDEKCRLFSIEERRI
eukprot:TRINITY_DN37400_c0_g2_i1.p1 TRINITY_DN37400_c0_g2~~TRINITY_DN37400_c0_g2_i1.p1  ORF type:complete len:484 (-),score=94.71 TRINITY_DN37400_c0_g2_i1:78-1529(-)